MDHSFFFSGHFNVLDHTMKLDHSFFSETLSWAECSELYYESEPSIFFFFGTLSWTECPELYQSSFYYNFQTQSERKMGRDRINYKDSFSNIPAPAGGTRRCPER